MSALSLLAEVAPMTETECDGGPTLSDESTEARRATGCWQGQKL